MDLNFDGLIDIIQLHTSTGFTVWTNKGNNVWQKGVYQNPDEDYFEEFTALDNDWDGTKELFLSSEDDRSDPRAIFRFARAIRRCLLSSQ